MRTVGKVASGNQAIDLRTSDGQRLRDLLDAQKQRPIECPRFGLFGLDPARDWCRASQFLL